MPDVIYNIIVIYDIYDIYDMCGALKYTIYLCISIWVQKEVLEPQELYFLEFR